MADLEIGVAADKKNCPFENAPLWVHRFRAEKPQRRRVWFAVAMLTGLISTLCYGNISPLLKPYVPDDGARIFTIDLVSMAYVFLVYYLTIGRDVPVQYVLRRSEKQIFESTVVVVSSFWAYFWGGREFWTGVLGLTLVFKVVPNANLWWDFENFGALDCCLILIVDVALFWCRDRGGVVLAGVGGAGVALQLIKNACRLYSSRKIKNENEKHLI